MGTLGQYLRSARESLGIDLRDAAQQTRISHNYLQALEAEDFSKLPGEVFVKGFLKNYGKFLRLDESEVLKRYEELRRPGPAPVAAAAAAEREQPEPAPVKEPTTVRKTPLEPFIWAAGIVIMLGIFVFTALPKRQGKEAPTTATQMTQGHLEPAPVLSPQPEKLYLEVIALESTWVLVRTDNSPQKKAILKEGESLIWSADERFLLSYGSAGALKILLNGQELIVKEPKNSVVRDLTITASGIVSRKTEAEYSRSARPKQQPGLPQDQPSGQPTSTVQRKPVASQPTSTALRNSMASQPTWTAQRKPAGSSLEKKTTPSSTVPLPVPWQGTRD